MQLQCYQENQASAPAHLYVWIIAFGKASLRASKRYEPSPLPVPPAIACVSTKPCRLSQLRASRSATHHIINPTGISTNDCNWQPITTIIVDGCAISASTFYQQHQRGSCEKVSTPIAVACS